MKRWKGKSAGARFPGLVLISGFGGILILLYVMYHIIVPFQPLNPLRHEATMGEPVIDSWDYKGMNEEGYLQFYNTKNGSSTELPPNDKMLALDGKFVMIEKAAPNAITYADPIEAIPNDWLVIILALAAFLGGLIYLRLKLKHRNRGFMTKSPRVDSLPVVLSKSNGRRFRAHK